MSSSSHSAQGFTPLARGGKGARELPTYPIVYGPRGFANPRCYTTIHVDSSSDEESSSHTTVDHDGFDAEIRAMYDMLSIGAKAAFRARYGSPPAIHTGSDQETEITIPDSVAPAEGLYMKKSEIGHVFPTTFTPPSTLVRLNELFLQRDHGSGTRYIHRDDPRCDPRKLLIFTAGACVRNGQPNSQAGWAIVHGRERDGKPAITSGHLEKAAPLGGPSGQTSNRAELWAVIAALRSRACHSEGFQTVVIATDSDYITTGATVSAKKWIQKDWLKGNSVVKNKDLWETLLGEVEKLDESGISVQFWRIQRDWNAVADAAAKKAAAEDEK
ncbi:ribonuclease H-like domain-containing protein [Nemania serpens]|nr:ribonuclease H-like domain-containing protein [Nemania serpens]